LQVGQFAARFLHLREHLTIFITKLPSAYTRQFFPQSRQFIYRRSLFPAFVAHISAAHFAFCHAIDTMNDFFNILVLKH
jgi:hypothetical protein